MQINEERLRSDLESNAEFGAIPAAEGRGRTVLTGTDADRRAREFFTERLRDADLDIRIDPVGNIVGRWTPDGANPDADPIATGSHLDSVPEGGIFDGPLGVYAGLEAIRSLQDADADLDRPVEVVNFTEEEGQRFGGGLIGSAVTAGAISVDDALAITDDDGIPLGDALADIGFSGDATIDASDWTAWFELHIEQAERLQDANTPVGVVTSIAGLTRCDVTVTGEANHAGATSMRERADPLTAASEFVLAVEDAATETTASDGTAVGTVGKLDVTPNAPNVIAGRTELTVDIRAVERDSIETVVHTARTELERLAETRGIDADFERPWHRDPVEMGARCRNALHAAGDATGIDTMDLASGAAHDTMHVAEVTDAALLFAPSRDGISHNPREWTDWEDCAAATTVLADAIRRLASE